MLRSPLHWMYILLICIGTYFKQYEVYWKVSVIHFDTCEESIIKYKVTFALHGLFTYEQGKFFENLVLKKLAFLKIIYTYRYLTREVDRTVLHPPYPHHRIRVVGRL